MTRANGFSRPWALVPLRLVVGFGFAAHGWAKLSRGPENFAGILTSLGLPMPHVAAWATSVVEFAGGIAVMAGAFVTPLSIPLAAIMLTAMVTVHARYGFSSVRLLGVAESGAQFGPIGYEMNLLYIAALCALAVSGASPLSVDAWLAHRRSTRRGS